MVSESPWKLLRIAISPESCAILLLKGLDEYKEALPHLSKIRSLKITVVLMVRNCSEANLVKLDGEHKLEFDRNILQINSRNHITGIINDMILP